MALGSYTTKDGYVLTAFSSMYVDFGLEITKKGETLHYNPHSLSAESYGFSHAERFEDYDEAIAAELEGEEDCFVEWSEKDWGEMLEGEADVFIEAFCPEESY